MPVVWGAQPSRPSREEQFPAFLPLGVLEHTSVPSLGLPLHGMHMPCSCVELQHPASDLASGEQITLKSIEAQQFRGQGLRGLG
jgi:hypothetical protein